MKLTSIHADAKLGANCTVEDFVRVEADVEIGDNCWIGPGAVIMSGTRLGNNCKVFPGAVLGAIPQDLKFEGEKSLLKVGNNVTIREYATLNRGTKANNMTVISDNCLLMAYVHVAHDCILHENVILANNVNLAGHIEIGKYSILGGAAAVHQFVNIGPHCMVGGGALVRKDVPPYVKVAREPLSYVGVNSVGLRRRGYSNKDIHHIQDIYRMLFVRGYNTTQALQIIEATITATAYREEILAFIRSADRGVIKGFRQAL